MWSCGFYRRAPPVREREADRQVRLCYLSVTHTYTHTLHNMTLPIVRRNRFRPLDSIFFDSPYELHLPQSHGAGKRQTLLQFYTMMSQVSLSSYCCKRHGTIEVLKRNRAAGGKSACVCCMYSIALSRVLKCLYPGAEEKVDRMCAFHTCRCPGAEVRSWFIVTTATTTTPHFLSFSQSWI